MEELQMSEYTELLHNLDELELLKIRSFLPEYLDKKKKDSTNIIKVLAELTKYEIEDKSIRISENLIRTAAFPYRKTLHDFDFSFNENIDKGYILDLATLRFVEDNKNVLFVGNPGVGKTHLAVALGILATQNRYSVYFTTAHQLITKLNKAHKENRLEKQLQHFGQYRILIIDEIGYLPIDIQGANIFFQLISKRYGKKSTIITTNMPFGNWGDVFNNNTIASAILDRLLHQAYIVKIVGESYRTKYLATNKKSAGT
jgi:DNA replication protein DnaC